ncbi:hypothetical protein [Altererythrobacter sp. GH1-8]|uniref:hypothetical protein n=1 Tax=Altererythrobacter sp. GH1-8 TaxID=3349333 RepID=UPI00374CB0C5
MSRGSATTPVTSDADAIGESDLSGWEDLRANGDIQFEPIVFPPPEPRELGWLERFLEWLVDNLNLGESFVGIWPVLKWVLIAALVAAGLMLLYRLVGLPMLRNLGSGGEDGEEAQWVPDKQESLALLEEADRLAASGQYDEATHLLLKRSVGQIAAARPEWVEPSSTARELAALRDLPEAAREAFGVIAERVERSLFALRQLDKADWEAARSAYARFAIAPIQAGAI